MFLLVTDIHFSDIGCLVLAKTTAKCSLPHPENERQWSVNDF
jgi:hypothetical protein